MNDERYMMMWGLRRPDGEWYATTAGGHDPDHVWYYIHDTAIDADEPPDDATDIQIAPSPFRHDVEQTREWLNGRESDLPTAEQIRTAISYGHDI